LTISLIAVAITCALDPNEAAPQVIFSVEPELFSDEELSSSLHATKITLINRAPIKIKTVFFIVLFPPGYYCSLLYKFLLCIHSKINFATSKLFLSIIIMWELPYTPKL